MKTFYLHIERLKTEEAIQDDRNRKYGKHLVQLRTRTEQDEKKALRKRL
jgi:hypothetical protein